jgi:hypothetical protein
MYVPRKVGFTCCRCMPALACRLLGRFPRLVYRCSSKRHDAAPRPVLPLLCPPPQRYRPGTSCVFLGHDFLSTAYFLPLGLISTMATPHAAPAAGHRRNKSSTSVLKSIVSRGHMRAPSDGAELKKDQLTSPPPYIPATNFKTPLLPPDHPHSRLRGATRTESIPTNPPASRRAPSQDAKQSRPKSLHKKTLSAVSLRTLAKKEENPRDKKPVDARRPQEEDRMAEKPKKIKSSANLAAMFGKGRSRLLRMHPVRPALPSGPSSAPASRCRRSRLRAGSH